MTTIVHRSTFNVSAARLFEFHLNAVNLAAISPPLPRFSMRSPVKSTEPGDLQEFRLSIGPFGTDWKARIQTVKSEPLKSSGARFLEDVQETGPFREWRHQHQVLPGHDGTSVLRDVVRFRFFPTPLGSILDRLFVAPGIKGMFIYRHWKTRRLLSRD